MSLARAHDLVVSLSGKAHEDSVHDNDRCRALILTCRNSPLWQRCERCNDVLSSFWPPWIWPINWTAWSSRDMCVNSNEPQVSRSLALWTTVEYERADANEVCPKWQSRTCYQECGCHLKKKKKKEERRWRNLTFSAVVSQLSSTQRYVCEYNCELLGSIILSACLVWGL